MLDRCAELYANLLTFQLSHKHHDIKNTELDNHKMERCSPTCPFAKLFIISEGVSKLWKRLFCRDAS